MAEQDSKKIFWDRHEAALLIDLCERVQNNVVTRADGLTQLSKALRNRAKLMGRKIDDDFRSVERIAVLYSMVEYLITDGLRGEPCAVPILASVRRIYLNEPDEFKKILAEAEHQCRQKVFEFDTHEVIKLIEASIKFSKLDDLNAAVDNLSKLLKDYAHKRGVDDSDTSRDVPEIVRRLSVIDGLRHGRQVESAAPREVFLVKLSKYDPEKFHALLEEANKALGVEIILPSTEILTEVLRTRFPSGLKYTSSIAMKQFRRCLGEEELRDVEDEHLIKALKEITIEHGEKLFLPYDERQQQLIDEIEGVVQGVFDSGYSCVYVAKLFERYRERLSETLYINSVTDFMERQGWEKSILTRDIPDITSDVQKFFRAEHRQITYYELERALWFIPFEKLKTAVIASPRIIGVKFETYMDLDAFPLDEAQRGKVEQTIKNALQPVQSMSVEECRRIVYRSFPELEAATADYTTQGFGSVLRGLYGNRFSFNRNMISAACEPVSKRQMFVDFCNERESFTLDELQAFAEEINSQIEFKSVRRVAVRIGVEQFLRRDQIKFDVAAIDKALDRLVDDCKSIKSLSLHFEELPPIDGFEWNEYILESYLFCFSEKFELINSVFSKLSWGGAAGRRSLHLVFEDVAEKILSKSKHWRDRETALDLLVNEKILLRRAFKDIDEVIRRIRADFD